MNLAPQIIDAYNKVIKIICEHLDPDEMSNTVAFHETFNFLLHVGRVHKKQKVDRRELFTSRTILLKTLKHAIGAQWNDKSQNAWIHLTNYMTVAIMSAFKLADKGVPIPNPKTFETVRLTWHQLENNIDSALEFSQKHSKIFSCEIRC